MLAAWNERDLDKIRDHLDVALSPDVTFADPNYYVEGIDAFEQMVREFRAKYPSATCAHTSGVDAHHNRCRYEWLVSVNGEPVLPGIDVTTLDDKERVLRVDGFFGSAPPLD